MADNAAAQAAPESTGNDGGEAAPVIDYGEILAQHQHELARSGKTVEALRHELGSTKDVLGRVQKAFTGDTGEKLTPYQQRQREFDSLGEYLAQEARENEKRGGQGLPVTTKIGQQLVAYGKEANARAEQVERELAELKETVRRQQNPAFQGLERAAFIMEGMVDEALSSMYGANDEARPIKAAQFNAVTARINEEIKDLMKNDPEALLKVQRNPKIMRNMVNHFMAEMLPPKVRSMMDEERIKNEPISGQQLMSAFAEARDNYNEATAKGDRKAADHWSNLITDIRRDILAQQLGGKKGGTVDKPSLNGLLSSYAGGNARS